MRKPELFDVAVEGGTLRVAKWGRGPIAIAAHGVTANHVTWQRVADHLGDDVTLIAPDLRGRGRSNGINGPFGMRAHAADLIAVLDQLGVDRATAVGHSMGGFVATIMATVYPERVENLVLVDSGMTIAEPPADGDIERLLDEIIGPSMARLKMTFATREDYRDFWRPHPAFRGAWDDYIQTYFDYDLIGLEPELHSSVSLDAVVEDSRDTLGDREIATAIERVSCSAMWIRCGRNVMDTVPGLYPNDVAAEWIARVPMLTDELVPDVNHFMVLLGEEGASLIADRIRKAVGA